MNTPTKPVEQKARELPDENVVHRHALAMMLAATPYYDGEDPRALHYERNRKALEAALAALNTDEERIRREALASLDRFGQHRPTCNIVRALPFERRRGGLVCTCGFDDAIRSLSSPSKEVGR